MSDEQDLAMKVGEVAGAVNGLAGEVGRMHGTLGDVQRDLVKGNDRMASIESTLNGVLAQQKITNGRIGKLEQATRKLAQRLGLVEQWQRAVSILPRVIDKLVENKLTGTAVLAAVSAIAGIAAGRIL